MSVKLLAALIAAGFAFNAANTAFAENPSAKPADSSSTTTPAAGDSEALSTLDAVNEHEIASAELAQKKQLTPASRDYALMLQHDHSANLAKVRTLSQETRTPISESPAVKALKEKTAAERKQLATLDGNDFEPAYLDAMIKGHADVLTKIDNTLLPQASNADITAHLRATRESVQKHRDEAARLKSTLKH